MSKWRVISAETGISFSYHESKELADAAKRTMTERHSTRYIVQEIMTGKEAMAQLYDASGQLAIGRDELGRIVREAWVRWAKTQHAAKPSWLVPYQQLAEVDKEADRQIGEAVCRATMLFIAARNGSPANDH